MRRAMMIDLDECVGCKACVSACKERWDTGPGAARDWVHTYETGSRGKDLQVTFYPGLCMQCAEHPCTADCPTGATFMDADGVVVVDPDLCIGCGNCLAGCPYGARHYDPVKKIVEKCNLCSPYLARGEEPACVTSCLAGCRHVGDLDDPKSSLVERIRATGAQPLVTAEVDVGPKVTFAGDAHRAVILAQPDTVRPPQKSLLTEVWTGVSLPFARYVVPLVGLGAVGGGFFVNFLSRKQQANALEARAGGEEAKPEAAAVEKPEASGPRELPRHVPGMRFIHWFNALSWVLLLATGTALMSARDFAFFGQAFPRWLAGLFGGAAELLRFHVVWGLVWAAVIVPLFLLYKRGGLEAVEEVWLRRGDVRWLLLKPLAMVGLAKQPLPPQGKYNAGQKVFAIAAVLGTAGIIVTGLVMTFHLGSAGVVAAAILLHKIAIALMLLGVSVHLTMAAIIRDERPALKSMITGRIDRHHAEEHSALWVEELEKGAHAHPPAAEEEKR